MAHRVPPERPEKSADQSATAASKNSTISIYEHPILSTTPSIPQTPAPRPTSWFAKSSAALSSDDGHLDGGWAAWSVVCGGWCGQFCSLGWINCMGVLQTQYELDQLQEYSSSTIAWIISLQTFLTFAGAPFFGRIFDSHGARGIMLFGIVMHVLGLMVTSVSTKYWHFILAQSVCSGVGGGAITYASLNSVATWFHERRAMAFGLASSGSGVGGVVTPIVFNKLKSELGFHWAIRCVAFMFLGILTLSCVTVRSRLKPNPQPWKLSDFLHPLVDKRFLSTVAASFVFHQALYLPMNYITLQALDQGMSENIARHLISILNAASVFGRIIFGRLGDKFGRYNCLIASAALCSLLVLILWLPGYGNEALIAFSGLFGFGVGAYISLIPACIAQLADIERIGVYNGVNWIFAATGALIGSPVGGALIRELHDGGRLYSHMIIFTGVALGSGVFLHIVARTVQAGMPSRI